MIRDNSKIKKFCSCMRWIFQENSGWVKYTILSILVLAVGSVIVVDFRVLVGFFLSQLAFAYNFMYSPPFDKEFLLSRSMTKQFEGQLYQLRESVRMMRDVDGTFHIYAKNKNDVFFAQGYISAQERLLDVEIVRRFGYGRLAEIKPESLIVDRLSRTLGFRRISERDLEILSDEDRVKLESFTSGINFYLDRMFDKYKPLEFFLGRIKKPEPFSVLDAIIMLRVTSFSFSRGWIGKVLKVAIRQWTSPEFEKSLDYRNLRWESLESVLDSIPPSARFEGSNSIAISPKLSATGKSLHEADPHLGVKTPSVWIPVHINIDDDIDPTDAFGYQLSCAPGIHLGFNRNISFGMTLSYGDSSEVFIEKISEDGNMSLSSMEPKEKWEEMKIIEEEIKIKGKKDPFVESVRITKNGPIVSGILDFQEKGGEEVLEYSMKLISLIELEEVKYTKFTMDLFTSKTWDEVVDLCHSATLLHVNVVYADIQDNIGICTAGAYPIRPEEYESEMAGSLCNGWEDKCEWEAFQSSQPMDFNPEEGFIVSANHDYYSDENRPYYMGIFRSTWRADRMKNLILRTLEQNDGKISLQQLEEISFDSGLEGPSLDFITSFAQMFLESSSSTDTKKDLLTFIAEKLVQFDGQFVPDSHTASIYSIFFNQLFHVLLERQGGMLDCSEEESKKCQLRREHIMYKGLKKDFIPSHIYVGLKRSILKKLWIDEFEKYNSTDTETKKIDAFGGQIIGKEALNRTILEVNEMFSIPIGLQPPNISYDKWYRKLRYGKLHRVRFKHVLGNYIPAYERVVEGYGNFDTPNMGGYFFISQKKKDEIIREVIFIPSCRIVVDLGDVENARTMLYPGSSNYLDNPWMFDGVKYYSERKTRKVRLKVSDDDIVSQMEFKVVE